MASFFDSIFGGTDPPPEAPNYAPLIGASTNLSNYAINQSGQVTGRIPTADAYAQSAVGRTGTADATSGWWQQMAQQAQQLAQQQFDWAKQTYAQNQGQLQPIMDNFTKLQQFQLDNAKSDRERYEGVFQPLQDKLVSEANDYASEGRKDLMRGRAMADVSQNFDAAKRNSQMELESYGINPGATRFAALDVGVQAQKAAAQAAAANQSDLQVENTARALRSEALGQGNLLPGQSVAEGGQSVAAGQSGAQTPLALTASGANTMGTGTGWSGVSNAYGGTGTGAFAAGTGSLNAGQGFYTAGTGASGTGASWLSPAASALNSAGNFTNTGYQNQLSNFNANQNSSTGFGTALGLAAKTLPMFLEEGGEVDMRDSPSGGDRADDVPARLTAGEFVIPKDAAQFLGEDKLWRLVHKAREDKAQAHKHPSNRSATGAGGGSKRSGTGHPLASFARPQQYALPRG